MPSDRTNTARQQAYRARQKAARATALVTAAPPPPAIPTMPGTARWKILHTQATAAIRTMIAEMEAYQGERSDAWQESDQAEEFQARLDAAAEALAALEALEWA